MSAAGEPSPWWFLYSANVGLTDDERATYAKVHSHGLDVDDLARRQSRDVRVVEYELASAERKVRNVTRLPVREFRGRGAGDGRQHRGLRSLGGSLT